MIKWGDLAVKTLKKYNKLPVQTDWKINKLRPSVSGIEQSHNIKWSMLPDLFFEKFKDAEDWAYVVNAIPSDTPELDQGLNSKNEECYVYLMKDLRNNTYKIGISINPSIREKTLQSEQPKMELIAFKKYINRKIAGSIEKALHETYSHKRKRGEWFNFDNEDIKELSATLDDKNG